MPGVGILSVWSYAWTCLSLYATLGIAWYLLDRHYGVHLYRWAYNMFHANPMPLTEVRGIMYNQSTNRKVSVALVISTVQSLYMIWGTNVNLMVEIILWLLEVPAMLIGFTVGAWVYAFLLRRSRVFDTMDQIGERMGDMRASDIAKEAKGASAGLLLKLASFVDRVKGKRPQPIAETQAAPPEPTTPEIQKIDAKQSLDSYTRRR